MCAGFWQRFSWGNNDITELLTGWLLPHWAIHLLFLPHHNGPLRTRMGHISQVCWKHGFLLEWPNDFGVTDDKATGLRALWSPASSASAGSKLLFSAQACTLLLPRKWLLHSVHNSSFPSFDSGAIENAVAIEIASAEHINWSGTLSTYALHGSSHLYVLDAVFFRPGSFSLGGRACPIL